SEEISPRYKPKMKAFVVLHDEYRDERGRKLLLDSLDRAPKQQDAVLAYLQLSRTNAEIAKTDLMEAGACSAATIAALIEKEVFYIREKAVSRLGDADLPVAGTFTLSAAQQDAFSAIKAGF